MANATTAAQPAVTGATTGTAAPAAAGQPATSADATTTERSPASDARRDPDALTSPPTLDQPPPGRRLSAQQAMAIADRVPKVRSARRTHPESTRAAFLEHSDRWQVSYYARPVVPGRDPPKEIAQVELWDRTGAVLQAWTGIQVPWTMARGYPGAFGRKANAPAIWIGLCVLFVLPFLRPPLRLLHLDLAVLLAFSVSYAYFQDAQIDVSVPLAYPLLGYLLVRMLAIALARGRADRAPPRAPLRLLTSDGVLATAVIFLLGFRAGLNITDSNVIDVGYASVVGADRLAHGEQLWGGFPSELAHGDTYGPVAYLAYLPFELLLPWDGSGWSDLAAAHAAAIAFDLLAVAGLGLLGRRLGGARLGLLLAYLWLTYPFTLIVANSNANDALVALLVIAALLAMASPVRRGVLIAAAGLTKFAPLGLAPLLATYRGPGADGQSVRAVAARFMPAFLVAGAVLLMPVLVDGSGPATFYERTVEFQGERDSPFSIWGLYDGLDGWQTALRIAVAGLVVAVAFVPRRRDLYSVAALAAAVLIALQLTVAHWFYLYLVWFLPLTLIAILARHVAPPTAEPAPSARRPHRSTAPPAPALRA